MNVFSNISEVAWIFDKSWSPAPAPSPTPISGASSAGVMVNPDFSLNVFGLTNLSGQRVRRVDQVPFRLGVLNTVLSLRRIRDADIPGQGLKVYSTITEVAWVGELATPSPVAGDELRLYSNIASVAWVLNE